MAQTQTFRRTCFLMAIFILISVSEIGTASEFRVWPGESIQDAVDSASPGDIIFIESGKYNESVHVNKKNLTIESASGNPDDTFIAGDTPVSYVFEVVANDVKINFFSITDGRCGIFLNNVENCVINGNKISNQEAGIYLLNSRNNLLTNNMVYANEDCGLKLLASSENIIYGNYFDNAENARDNKFNIWNKSKGNYWSDYGSKDENEDGIGDTPYAINPKDGSMDYRPLIEYSQETPVLPKALFTSDVTEGYTPLVVRFKDFSENAASRLWDFGDGNSSSYPNPQHTYLSEGTYSVTLNASNENGSDSASVTINVRDASELEGPILPKAQFIYNTTSGHIPLVIKFVDISENADCIIWYFGDGKTSCCPVPMHTFCSPGSYTVSIAATNENGTSSASIVVNALPAESIESSDDAANKGNSDENDGCSVVNETGKDALEDAGNPEPITRSENTDNPRNSIAEYASDTVDKLADAEKIINEEVTENSESDSNGGGEETGIARIIHREEFEAIKDSVISTASSNTLTETKLALENETLKVRKNVEDFVDDSLPESIGDSLPEVEQRISPWIPSFLGLAGVVFIVSLMKRGKRRK
ncbi:PKD domain-containing protein [Methanosarcina siciliae]|nr:PKD domain-containing protein [Methanosarcina siciliae]